MPEGSRNATRFPECPARFMKSGMRLSAFILLPTLVGFFYFAFVATPSYATKSEFIVQQALSGRRHDQVYAGVGLQ